MVCICTCNTNSMYNVYVHVILMVCICTCNTNGMYMYM